MSQEIEKNSNQVNIDSSSNSTGSQEEKKYVFNQSEVNTNQNTNQNQPQGQQYQQPNNQWQRQPGPQGQQYQQPNNQWQGQPGQQYQQPNNQWQGQPGQQYQQPNNQWQGQPGQYQQPNNQWQGQPNQNQQWQNQNNQQYSNANNQQKRESMNPFKLFSSQPVKVPKIKTNEDARNVYFGVNQQYYNKVYKEYKQGKKISWNWSAFLFRSYWFFSRKMYAIGALYTLMMSFISFSVVQISQNITNPQILTMVFPWAVAFIGLWAAAGMFGNYMYMAHMENKIVYPSDKSGSAEQMTQLNVMRGGFSLYGILLCFMATDLILTLVQYIAEML